MISDIVRCDTSTTKLNLEGSQSEEAVDFKAEEDVPTTTMIIPDAANDEKMVHIAYLHEWRFCSDSGNNFSIFFIRQFIFFFFLQEDIL